MKNRMLRVPKKGFVYLLKSDQNVYKFGCTTQSPTIRCNSTNRRKLDFGYFQVVCFLPSSNIYCDEKLIKWRLWGINIPIDGEFFSGDNVNQSTILKLFKNDKSYEAECL
jgi:hypothetical protein